MERLKNKLVPKLNMGPGNIALPPPSERSIGIPRTIHQTFHQRELPPALSENVHNLKAMNPGWEHRLYDNEEQAAYVRDVYGSEIYKFFDRIDPKYGAARSDLFRYLLLYKEGGVYLDIKSSTLRPLDEVITPDDSFVLTNSEREFASTFEELKNTPFGEILQWNIISSPKHPFLKAVIEAVLRNIQVYSPALHGVGRYGVFRLTGPVAYSLAIGPLLDTYPNRFCGFDCDYREKLGLNYSVLRHRNEHRKLFTTHYAKLEEQIIAQTGLHRIRESNYVALKLVRDSIVRLLR